MFDHHFGESAGANSETVAGANNNRVLPVRARLLGSGQSARRSGLGSDDVSDPL